MLLAEAGFRFKVEPADLDEEALATRHDPRLLPQALAEAKAAAVAGRFSGETVVVLAADTVVYSSLGEVLNKPANAEDARRMLRTLSGSLHCVVTGFSAIRCNDGRCICGQVRSDVLMRPLSDAEVDDYVRSGSWEGKAGGYGVQDTPGSGLGHGDPFIESITGELTNIVGLPMPQVVDALLELGVWSQASSPSAADARSVP